MRTWEPCLSGNLAKRGQGPLPMSWLEVDCGRAVASNTSPGLLMDLLGPCGHPLESEIFAISGLESAA
jgi:hypothetical protein